MTSVAPQQRRGSWAFPLLLIVLLAVPFIEIYLLVQVGQLIGVWWTLGILLAEAVLGAWLMRREGARAWKALNEAFVSGKPPTGELADTALILVGGVLLVLPGFVTDLFGLLFLLPFTRPLARKVLAYVIARRMARLGVSTTYRRQGVTVIEGETVADPQPGNEPGAPNSGPVIIAGEIDDGQAPGRQTTK